MLACVIPQLCLILYDPLESSPPGSSVHEIFQARILEWVAISSFRGSPQQGIQPMSPALQTDSLPPGPSAEGTTSYADPWRRRLSQSVQLLSHVQIFRPHGQQHAKLPCSSPTPGAYSNSCPLSQRCHPNNSTPVIPFSSCLKSFPGSGSFPVSQFCASCGQNTEFQLQYPSFQ